MPKRTADTMTAEEFAAAIDFLFESRTEAMRTLRVCSLSRLADFAAGRRRCPPYLAAHVDTLLRLTRKRRDKQ
jgi:hypothetical protein